MASFLFTDNPAKQTSESKTSKAAFAIRTMQDDIESVKNGEQESPQSQPSKTIYQAQTISSATESFPSVANQSLNEEKGKEGEEKNLQNPFGITPDTAPEQPSSYPAPYRTTQDFAPSFSAQPITENGLASLMPEGSILINQQSYGKKKMLVIFVIIFIFSVTIGLWYSFFGGKEQFYNAKEKVMKFLFLSDVNVIEQIDNLPKMVKESEMLKSEPYSSDKPNYLPFNTETVSPEDIRATFSQIVARIQESSITKPIEFLVTDQNNNPLAFNRFAFLLKLDLNPEMLSLAEESFSLYAYNDTGSVRFGLVLDFKDTETETISDIIKKTETGLPYALRPLIIEQDVPIEKKLTFQSNNYNQFQIRFANIDIEKKIAIDYALYNNRLFVGTSKETLRAILDSTIQAEKK